MKFQLIGIDLDGTLLDERGKISRENLEAITRAQVNGALVVPCTGRSWQESKAFLAAIPDLSVGVFVTGAAVTHISSGRSLDLSVIEPNLAAEIVNHLYSTPEAVLVFRDSELAGHDYLVTGEGELTANSLWWFENCGAQVRHQPHPTADDLHHTLRIGIVASEPRIQQVMEELEGRFGDHLFMHYFQAIQRPRLDGAMFVLEMFATGVNKWQGIKWIARQRKIRPSRIAVIGDGINDTTMLHNAGCGIAMQNAIEEIKRIADHVTRAHTANGVAHAIDQLLSGAWT